MKGMLKQILFIITPIAAAVVTATPLAPPRLLASRKRKKKNSNNRRTKKRNDINHFTVINAIKEEDNDKEEVKARIPAEVVIAIVAATFKAGDIYKNDA